MNFSPVALISRPSQRLLPLMDYPSPGSSLYGGENPAQPPPVNPADNGNGNRKRARNSSSEEESGSGGGGSTPGGAPGGGPGGDAGGKRNNPLISDTEKCRVCLEPAAKHIHYGAVTCFSCRAFFRRSVQQTNTRAYNCRKSGNCEITLKTRKNCQKCRYEKCVAIGMKTSWVLSEDERRRRFRKSREKKQLAATGPGSSGGKVKTESTTSDLSDRHYDDIMSGGEDMIHEPMDLSEHESGAGSEIYRRASSNSQQMSPGYSPGKSASPEVIFREFRDSPPSAGLGMPGGSVPEHHHHRGVLQPRQGAATATDTRSSTVFHIDPRVMAGISGVAAAQAAGFDTANPFPPGHPSHVHAAAHAASSSEVPTWNIADPYTHHRVHVAGYNDDGSDSGTSGLGIPEPGSSLIRSRHTSGAEDEGPAPFPMGLVMQPYLGVRAAPPLERISEVSVDEVST